MSMDKIIAEMRESADQMENVTYVDAEIVQSDQRDWADRLSALRGEAVAWMIRRISDGYTLDILESKDAADTYAAMGQYERQPCYVIPLYTAPPAPVVTEEVREAVIDALGTLINSADKDDRPEEWTTVKVLRAFLREQGVE